MKDAENTLLEMTNLLTSNKIEFSIGGTGLLYYLDLYETVGDWDILTNATEDQVLECIKELDYSKVSVKHHFYSQFMYQVNLNGFEFDIMGNFKYEVEGELISVNSTPHMWKKGIPLADPSQWQSFYERINRESKKDRNKSELLKQWLSKQ